MDGAGTGVEAGRPVRLTRESRRSSVVGGSGVLAVATVGMVRGVQLQNTF